MRTPTLLLLAMLSPAPDALALGAGDLDRDGDVDLADLIEFQTCYTGSGEGSGSPLAAECRDADLDGDADVDLADYMAILARFTGPTPQADPYDPTGAARVETGDRYSINERRVYLQDGRLHVDVSYSGGCETHTLTLRPWAPPNVRLAFPHFFIHHDAANDACEALIQRTLRYDLSAFLNQSGVTRIGLFTPEGQVLIVGVDPAHVDFGEWYELLSVTSPASAGRLEVEVGVAACDPPPHIFTLRLAGCTPDGTPLLFIHHGGPMPDPLCDAIEVHPLAFDVHDLAESSPSEMLYLLGPDESSNRVTFVPPVRYAAP